MNIAILCQYPFPIGYSGTNRIISYSRGLVELGNSVTVYVLHPTESRRKVFNEDYKGEYLGIKYQYPFRQTIKKERSVFKSREILGVFKTLIDLRSRHKRNKYDWVFISNDNHILYPIMSFFIKTFLRGSKVLFITDEYPEPIRSAGRELPNYRKQLFVFGFYFTDAIITMTNTLDKYYGTIYKKDSRLIVPMTVETNRFDSYSPVKYKDYIAYVGNLEISKDGVDILIEAFSKVNKSINNCKLILFGEAIEADLAVLKKLTFDLGLKDKVVFAGKVERAKIPDFLGNAKALVLARGNSARAEGGFPTKLGEYLSTGKPVVVTDVGEIGKYLKDRDSAFIAEPDNVDSFAAKMLEVFDDYERALVVGDKGKIIAKEAFDYLVQSRRIDNFLKNIRNI